MATMKRRVIYMDDDLWTELRVHAHDSKLSISELLRAAWVTYENELGPTEPERVAMVDGYAAFVETTTAVANERFNSRPFTPVPKHGK